VGEILTNKIVHLFMFKIQKKHSMDHLYEIINKIEINGVIITEIAGGNDGNFRERKEL
jgi:hypothetical protein